MFSEGESLAAAEMDFESPFVSPSQGLPVNVAALDGSSEVEFPFAVSAELEPPYGSEEEAPPTGSISARAVAIALAELERWNPPQKAKRKETDPSMRDTLRAYWGTVVGANEVEARISNRDAWSAAFISWVMAQAGAGTAFKYAAAHRAYVSAAKAARLATDRTKYWAYRVSEVRPEPGDIVCRDRRPKEGAPCNGTTYDNVDNGTLWATHSDIVIACREREIDVIGGNVGDSVSLSKIALDASGRLAQPGGCKYYAVLKPPAAAVEAVGSPTPGVQGGALAQIAVAMRAGSLPIEAGLAIASGSLDENRLTNLVFYAQHPEIPPGHKIGAHEKALAQDWVRIREQVVRPLLRRLEVA